MSLALSTEHPELYTTSTPPFRKSLKSTTTDQESRQITCPDDDLFNLDLSGIPDIELQPVSLNTWHKKYRSRSEQGQAMDENVDDTCKRVARALADVESADIRQYWYRHFLWALRQGATPAGRILFNAGTASASQGGSVVNSTVSGAISDSLDDILAKAHEASLILKAGCGIGYDFSTIRPRSEYDSIAGVRAAGPLAFMDIFDKMCQTITAAGDRRGAQMATFDIRHPDVLEFITAKKEDGRLRQFNLSLLITDEFIEAVRSDKHWQLVFPLRKRDVNCGSIALDDPENVIYTSWSGAIDDAVRDAENLVACRIYDSLPARRIWDLIMTSNYDYAEPGFILVDRLNHMNNNWFCEDIRATNSCGEQGLPAYGACLLGSINLTRFVRRPFTDEAYFDWDAFRNTVKVFTRMLDNAIELNGLPLHQQREELFRKRRHGMGYLGLGSTITLLGMHYGSDESLAFTEDVTRELALEGWRSALALAREKGPAPIMEELFSITKDMLAKCPKLQSFYSEGDQVPGKVLHARFSQYMQLIGTHEPQLIEELAEIGARFTHHSSIAPTGTTSLSLANNASNGIEPSFAHEYSRNLVCKGRQTKENVKVLSYELLLYRALINPQASSNAEDPVNRLPTSFMSVEDIRPEDHIAIQAAAQKWIDSSISKTVNVPTDMAFEQFKDVYMSAWQKGLKGCSTFRFNPERFQGVLVNDKDLENTLYTFELEDGSTVSTRGNEEIEYDGGFHTAANLFDALKEGYFRHSVKVA